MKTAHKAGAAIAIPAAVAALAGVFIPHWESGGRMDLTVRHQSFDPPGVYTVCHGVTNRTADYSWIRPGMKFTTEQCAEAFNKILPKYYGPIADCIPSLSTMPAHRQVALLDAAYNLGPGRICTGGVAREFNAGNVKGGCELLGQYVRANGKVLPGLENRRFDPKWGEIDWCLKED